MNDKTIKELADDLGLSKSYIDKIIRTLNLHTELDKIGNKYVISKTQENLIKSVVFKDKSTTRSHTYSTNNTHNEVDFLREQLRSKNEEMKNMQKLLDQQQQLTLQSNQRIEQLEKQLQIGLEKAETEEEDAPIQKTPEPEKKWWSFFKR